MCSYNRKICFVKGADIGWLKQMKMKDINFVMIMEKKKIVLRSYKVMV